MRRGCSNYISANDVDGDPGVITYTQWLNEGGTLEADLTVTKLDDEQVLGRRLRYRARARRDVDASAHRRRRARVRHRRDVRVRADQHPGAAFARADAGGHVGAICRTPRSRTEPRARSTSASPACSASGSPTSASSATSSTSRPSRPRTCTTALSTPGAQSSLRHAGLKALASLRMEKGYRDYGHDIDNTDSVLEAGSGFRGRSRQAGWLPRARRGRWRRRRRGRSTRRILQILVQDPDPLMFHAEVVRRNDEPVGYVRAASYGFTLGGAVGLVMVEAGEPVDQAYVTDANVGRRDRRARGIRPSRRSGRCTTRRWSGSRADGGPRVNVDPARVHYRSMISDSARWEGFEFRPDDIIISTPAKCGTTWMQMICALLVFQTPTFDRSLDLISPWLEMLTRDRDVGSRRSRGADAPAVHQEPHAVRRPAVRSAASHTSASVATRATSRSRGTTTSRTPT